jgi:hypothetical protein
MIWLIPGRGSMRSTEIGRVLLIGAMVARQITDWAMAVLVSTIAGLSFLGLLLLIRASGGILWSQEAAGWTGAVGAVFAIVGAFAIAGKQHSDAVARDRQSAIDRRSERESAVKTVVSHCFALIYGLPSRRMRREDYEAHKRTVPRSAFRNLRDMLRAAPIYELTDANLVRNSIFMLEHMDAAIKMMEEFDELTTLELLNVWQEVAGDLGQIRQKAWDTHQNMKAGEYEPSLS